MSKFSCNYCQKSFSANFNLRPHVRIFHKDNVQPEIKRGRKPKIENTVTCDCVLRNSSTSKHCAIIGGANISQFTRKHGGANVKKEL